MLTLKDRRIRERLIARRTSLLGRYRAELERADQQQQPEAEAIDAASEQWDATVLSTISEADARMLDEVAAAVRRLDAGCYGVCAGCGARIEAARLRVLPEAAQCAECATFAEEQRPRWTSAR